MVALAAAKSKQEILFALKAIMTVTTGEGIMPQMNNKPETDAMKNMRVEFFEARLHWLLFSILLMNTSDSEVVAGVGWGISRFATFVEETPTLSNKMVQHSFHALSIVELLEGKLDQCLHDLRTLDAIFVVLSYLAVYEGAHEYFDWMCCSDYALKPPRSTLTRLVQARCLSYLFTT